MREKRPLVVSQDYGKDETSVGALIKKLDNVARDLDSFKTTVEKLSVLCVKLTERRHFDSENITKKMVSVTSNFQYLSVYERFCNFSFVVKIEEE